MLPVFKVGSTVVDFIIGASYYSKLDLGSNKVVVGTRFTILPMKLMIMVLGQLKQQNYLLWKAEH